MTDDERKLREMLDSGGKSAWGAALRSRHPYLPVDGSGAQLDALRARTPRALRQAGGAAPFYPESEAPRTPDTNTAIDDFLSRYANTSPEEEAMLERMIFNPVPDYAQQLAREAENDLPAPPPSGSDSHADRINRFILADRSRREEESPLAPQAPAGPVKGAAQSVAANTGGKDAPRRKVKVSAEAPKVAPQSSLLSESLAKIYIKSHKYERAFEILSRLSLEFPEKSRYFADQLRFLRKLIVNQRACEANNTSQTASKS